MTPSAARLALLLVAAPASAATPAGPIQPWNPEGSYAWSVELIDGFLGTLTVFKRPDGSWGCHGTLGGTAGEVLLGKSTVVKGDTVTATLTGATGETVIRIVHAAGKYTGSLTLVDENLNIEIKVTKTAD